MKRGNEITWIFFAIAIIIVVKHVGRDFIFGLKLAVAASDDFFVSNGSGSGGGNRFLILWR